MKELSPLTCLRCSEQWTPKVDIPRYCPRCKSPFWNTPYRRGPKKTVEEQVAGTAIQPQSSTLSYAEQVKFAIQRMRK